MEHVLLNAGNLSLEYTEGRLRYIRFGDTELIRGIYFAVRDSYWGTLPLLLHHEKLEYQGKGFTLSFQASSTAGNESIVGWEGIIQGDESDQITFSVTGTFLREYASNRVGFCLLHPLKQLLGQPFEVQSRHGKRKSGIFPRLIAPYPPATDMAGLSWKTTNGIACQLTFEGDLFEMEDQRNWTDASFKSYCTPLKNGWPKTYHEGDTVSQLVLFHLVRYDQPDQPESMQPPTISLDTSIHYPWPGIGSRIPNAPLSDLNAHKVANLPINLLRADIVWGANEWEETLAALLNYAENCGKPLHLVLHYLQGDTRVLVHTLHRHCAAAMIQAISVVMKDRVKTDSGQIQFARQLIRQRFPQAKLGVGTQYLFTQLNRNRPDGSVRADFLFFGNNPQVHTFDNQSIIETIEGQSETLKSARAIAPHTPIYVSPITLNAPFSPDKLPKDQSIRDTLPYDFAPDSRQGSAFTAGWVLGCIGALAVSGASQLDFFETEGERGLIIDGQITPTYSLLGRILGRVPIQIFHSQSSDPLKFSTLGIATEKGKYLYVANHTADRLVINTDDGLQEIGSPDSPNHFITLETISDARVLNLPPFGLVEVRLRK